MIEQWCAVMRTRACFRVTLEAERWFVCTMNPLKSLIEQRLVRSFQALQEESLHPLRSRGFEK